MIKRLSIISVITAIVLCGCKTMDARNAGQIEVSRPLVSSRESLVLDRQRELTWLNSKLSMPITHGIQARRFTRDITSLTGSLSVQADPFAIKKYKAQQELDLENIARFKELNKITHENKLAEEETNAELNAKKSINYISYIDNIIELDELRTDILHQTYKAQKAIKESVCEGTSANPVLDANGNQITCEQATISYVEALSALKAELPEGEQINSVLKPGTSDYITGFKTETIKDTEGNDKKVLVPIYGGSIDYSKINSQSGETLSKIEEVAKELKALKDVLKVDKTNADDAGTLNVTAIDAFEDDLSFRNRVNDQIAKVKLDERHDTYGNTLYRLQYAITVVPRDENPNWVKVEVELRPESTTLYPEGIFKWMYSISKAERVIRNEKYISPSITPSTHPLTIAKTEENRYLQRMRDYYVKTRQHLPRSVSTWTDNFIIAMREEIRRNYVNTLDAWKNNNLSQDQIYSLDKQLGTICRDAAKYNEKISDYNVRYDRSKDLLTFFQNNCDYKNLDLPVRINASNDTRYRQTKYYHNFGSLKKDLNTNSNVNNALKKQLLILQHYLIAFYSVSEVSRDYDYLKYLNVNYLDLRPDQNPGTFADSIYLTWIQTSEETPKPIAQEGNAQNQQSRNANQVQSKPKPFNKGLWQLLSDLTAGYTADVYSVHPNESAQRIEDVAEVIKTFGFDLGVQFLAGSVGGEAAISYLKGKEKLFSTILRKPVVIGLPGQTLEEECDKNDICKPKGVKFGWIIGPVFKIKNDRQDAEFVQAATKKVVSADIAVPAWWRSLSMNAKVAWIKPKYLDELKNGYYIPIASTKDPVFLPAQQPDFREMMRASPRPILDAKATEQTNINGEEPILILRGKDLWRIHAVSIGNETSDQIEVLGDMQTVKVDFPKLTQSACKPDFIKSSDNSEPECESTITLWSRNAAPVIYDTKARIIWKKPVSRPIETNKIQFSSILPAKGIVVDPEKSDKLPVKIFGAGMPKEVLGEAAKTKWNINFGDTIIAEAIARDEGSDGQSISFSFPQKEAWGATCHNIKPGKNCEVKIRIYYDDNLLRNGTLTYNLIRKTK